MGPCLCGDIYCSSCGNPAQAELEEKIEAFVDEISDFVESPQEIDLILEVGRAAVLKMRAVVDDLVADRANGDALYISHLQCKVDLLRDELQELREEKND